MSKKFEEVKQLQYPTAEVEVLNWWKKRDIFRKSLESRDEGIPFTFYEGPPTANGKPGIHHVLSRTVKDLFCRYQTPKGDKVERKARRGTHGLPVEIEVEKALGLAGRSQVEEYGIADYNRQCRESVLKYKELWDDLTTRMGYWVDLEDPYVTFENSYIESIWCALHALFDKGLIYQWYKIQWYSPGSGTVLSSHEVSLGYEDTQDPSIFVKFPLEEDPEVSFLAWTTTPWTIVSNMALAVNPELDYVKVKTVNEEQEESLFILAEGCLDSALTGDYEIIERYRGEDLVGWRYQPVFDDAMKEHSRESAWRVIAADYVTVEDGTGVVHTAPAFGADDYETAREAGIPMFNPIDREGRFTEKAPDFQGLWFKDADKEISRAIKEKGLMYRHETVIHSYPFDWRKGTPLMSYPVESWFIRTTAFRDRMVELNRSINWKPESTGTGRFGSWLENNVDWAVSRQRYWGTPLPLWVNSDNPEHVECIGSIEELKKKAGISDDEEIDLHRPYIDDITWKAPDGGTMVRVPDLLDVWFDSGAMPFAQWHYPFENKKLFKSHFPADFIAEGVDQTRGWFYTLHALATMLFDQPAYHNVVSNGLVLDKNGEKMSKSKGNTVDPFEMIQEYGADVVRWYMMGNSAPWDNLKFSEEGLKETQRKFFNTVVSTYSFFAMYANIDRFTYSGKPLAHNERTEMDRWIISRMNTTIKLVDEYLEDYEPTKAVREIEMVVDDLSNWYVRRNRRRFWKEGKSLDKTGAYQTLSECLVDLATIMSPVAPFLGEWLFRNISRVIGQDAESVHLSFYPTVEETAIDKQLEHRMEVARIISSTVLRMRNQIDINVRQPLARIILPMDREERQVVESVKEIILDEVNVKQIEFVDDDSEIVTKSAKPNFPVLGKKLGKKMKAVAARVRQLETDDITAFEKQGFIDLIVDGDETLRLGKNDLQIIRTGLEGWSVETEKGITVALDTELTDELVRDGLARELVNRIQNMRKEADFDVTDHIEIGYVADDLINSAVSSMKEYIMTETLADDIQSANLEQADFTKSLDIEGDSCMISIKRNMNN